MVMMRLVTALAMAYPAAAATWSVARSDHFEVWSDGGAETARETLFYAESWALAEMLLVAPEYAPRFTALLAMVATGSSSQAAIEGVYRTSIDTVFRDLRTRVARGAAAIPLPGLADESSSV